MLELASLWEGTGNKQHEIYMPNANPILAYPTQPIFHLVRLGLALDMKWSCRTIKGHTRTCIRSAKVHLGSKRYLDTNILVWATQNSDLSPNAKWVCFLVEYGVYSLDYFVKEATVLDRTLSEIQ